MQLPGSVPLLLLAGLLQLEPPCAAAQENSKLMSRLGYTLHLILTRTCAAHNMSVYVSTGYQELLPPPERRVVQQVLHHLLLQRHDSETLVPIVMDRRLGDELVLRVQLAIFFVQSVEQLQVSILPLAGQQHAMHKHKLIVVLLARPEDDDAAARGEMQRIFDYMLHGRYNIDVLLLLVMPALNRLRAYSFWPYDAAHSCESTRPIAVSLRQGQLQDLYPRKLHNLRGCPLHVILWNIPPYIELQPARGDFVGWDASILKVLAGKLNFSVALVPNEPPDLIGGVSFANGTMTGAFEMLRQRRGNLSLGCAACAPERYRHLTATGSYKLIEYVVVLRAGQRYSSFEIMLFPFDSYTWQLLIALAVLRLLGPLLWAVAGVRRRLPAPVLIGWSMLLFMLRIGYESSVFDYVHNGPTRPLPRTLDEVMREGYDFIMDHATYRMTLTLPGMRARSRILPGLPTDMFDQLLQRPLASRTAVLSSLDFLAYHLARHPEQRHRYTIVDERVMNNMVCMYFPMGSYMAPAISELLFQLRSFGICQHLSRSIKRHEPGLVTTANHRGHPLVRKLRNTPASVQFVESMRFLLAAISCLLLGELLTLGVFVLELLSRQSRRLRWFFASI
ncbi:hypothetical protein KR222_008882 [Zaprionus bogoriensis]|nr:hypothetical protein KR222_008882 [Zaprionus bogoriensis]